MGTIIRLKDGSQETILTGQDLIYLIDTHMGSEMKEAVLDWVNAMEDEHLDDDECIHDLNEMISEDHAHYKSVMKELDKASVRLADLIAAENLDRRAISEVTGKIRSIIRKESR